MNLAQWHLLLWAPNYDKTRCSPWLGTTPPTKWPDFFRLSVPLKSFFPCCSVLFACFLSTTLAFRWYLMLMVPRFACRWMINRHNRFKGGQTTLFLRFLSWTFVYSVGNCEQFLVKLFFGVDRGECWQKMLKVSTWWLRSFRRYEFFRRQRARIWANAQLLRATRKMATKDEISDDFYNFFKC